MAQGARDWDSEYVASCTHLANPPELNIPQEYQATLCGCYFKNVSNHDKWSKLSAEKAQPFTGTFDNIHFSKVIAMLALEGVLPLTKRPEIVKCLNDAHKNTPAENPAGAFK